MFWQFNLSFFVSLSFFPLSVWLAVCTPNTQLQRDCFSRSITLNATAGWHWETYVGRCLWAECEFLLKTAEMFSLKCVTKHSQFALQDRMRRTKSFEQGCKSLTSVNYHLCIYYYNYYLYIYLFLMHFTVLVSSIQTQLLLFPFQDLKSMKFQVSADKKFILMAYSIRPVSTSQYEVPVFCRLYHYTML